MDRQRRLPLVQFWLVVSGLRNPLEDDIPSSDEEDSISATAANFSPWSASDRNDIAQIHDAYLSKSGIPISDKPRRYIKEFLKHGDRATQKQYIKARFAILRAQTAVYNDMLKKDFPGFRASDLWYKYLASGDRDTPMIPSPDNNTIHEEAASPPIITGRHSFDAPTRELRDDWETDPMSSSLHDIRGDEWSAQNSNLLQPGQNAGVPGTQIPESNIVEAMEAALSDIIENRPNALGSGRDSPLTGSKSLFGLVETSPRSSLDSVQEQLANAGVPGKAAVRAESRTKPPSLSSLGLVSGKLSGEVFKEDLFPEEAPEVSETLDDDYTEVNKSTQEESDDEIHQAAPGDLGLAEAIVVLSYDIEKLCTQEAVIDSLYRKAELTNNVVEMRILKKSKASLQREIRRKELQRQQYIVQESDNSLYVGSSVEIRDGVADSLLRGDRRSELSP
jgi:sorting nexin-25